MQRLTGLLRAAALAGAACFASWSAQAATDTLVVGVSQAPTTVSPAAGGYFVLSLVFQTWEPLVARDADDQLQPALAERWEMLSPTHWRFHLRKDVKWHDGTPFTAADVKYTIDYVTDPKTVYVRKGRIEGVVSTEVVDDDTVDIFTESPAPLLLRGLADIAIEQKAISEQLGAAEAQRKPVGTGPWKFDTLVPNEYYDLVANEDYWGGAPAMKKLRIRGISEGATRVSSLIAGETHVIEEVPVDLLPSLQRRRGIEIDAVESSVSLVLTFDTREKPFDDKRVRQAVDYAIDKELLLKQMLGGYGSVLDGQLVTRNTFGHNPDIEARPYDPAKARELLAQAGYPQGFTTEIKTMSGRYLSDIDIANAAAGMMSEVGVKTTVNNLEAGVWSQLDRAREQGPIYQIGWFSVGDADFSTVWYTEASKRNYWTSAEFDQLWKDGRSTLDDAERLKAYHRMMQIMYDEVPSIFLFGLPRISARSAAVQGWTPARDSLLRLARVRVE
ncbi:ABC transporter substrate-binding protein [Verticiella sediminum]|nr:ABC transporter substrate-binding protein [Verticiella sediminum]